jgi:ESS family glutamate:Na+ symporter
VASAIAGILVAGLMTGSFGAFLIRRDLLSPSASDGHVREAVAAPATLLRGIAPVLAPEPLASTPALLSRVLVLFGIAMGIGYLLNAAANRALTPLGISLPAYVGAMIVASALRFARERFPALTIPDHWNTTVGLVALSWFIPLALWTLKYWELRELAGPIALILAAELPLTLALAWLTYRMVGRTFDSAVIASGYFGFMFGTMANSLASMGEISDRFGHSRQAYLIIPIVGGVLSDFAIILAITFSRVVALAI